MRTFRFVMVMMLAFGAFGAVNAQKSKIGHVNVKELIAAMPKFKSAQDTMATITKKAEEEIVMLQNDLQQKQVEFQQNGPSMAPEMQELKYKELMQQDANLKQYYQQKQQDLAVMEQKMLEPVMKEAQDAINAVAKANGFTYIIDSSVGILVYMDGGIDVMDLVKKQLGIGS